MKQYIKYGIGLILCWVCARGAAQRNDSLDYYLEWAGRNNPVLKAEFSTYRASLERIPQAGAFSDLQLDMGFYVKPMAIVDGKQIADFTLMQMFPWFGTRKAARSEAMEMARMSFEKFRESRDKLFYDVKSAWYALVDLQEQLRSIREHKAILASLKDLSVRRFSASGRAVSASRSSAGSLSSFTSALPASGDGMSGMGAMDGGG
ncbi:MAG: TolC family protein [Paraprevotella sp.]|nr:TolC family protein [Paraprevotella sp.]